MYHFAAGQLPSMEVIWLINVGEVIAPVRTARPSPFRASRFCDSRMAATVNSPHMLIRPSCSTVSERSGSYRLRIEACSKIPVAPKLAG